MIYKDQNGKETKIGSWVTFLGRVSKTRYIGQIINLGNNINDDYLVDIKTYNNPVVFHNYSGKSIIVIDDATAMLYILEN